MNRILAFTLALIVIALSYTLGRHAGVRHAIESLQIYAIEHIDGFSTRVLIDFDGQVHEYIAN